MLLAFIAVEGRLPCPATNASDGTEQINNIASGLNSCTLQHGFVPGVTLGFAGQYSADNLLLDPFGNPYRYSVSSVTAGGNAAAWDFVSFNDLTLDWPTTTRTADLRVCDSNACAGTVIADNIPAVIFSMGKDWGDGTTSLDQLENLGATVGTPPFQYNLPNDNDFVSKEVSLLTGQEYDDQVVWVSIYQLYAQLLLSGRI